MDHTEALPDDVLASILRTLPPRDLATSRCIRKAWLDVVDAHALLLPHVLPRSVHGLFFNYVDYDPPRLFSRPSARTEINLTFLPNYRYGIGTIVDHCNGLLLCWDYFRTLAVVNPATRRWEYVDWKDESANPRLVFDPAASPHYEVLSVPKSPSDQNRQKSDFSTSSKSSSTESKGDQDDPDDLMEWPSLRTLNVFSSSTGQWKTRSFIREDDVVGTITNARLDPLESFCWRHWGDPRWRYNAYWQGSLYVHGNDAFVARLSLSDCKYQLIKTPIDTTEKTEHTQFLGKSEKGVYLAAIHGICQLLVWSLVESRGKIDWVLKHDIDLEPLSMVWLNDVQFVDKIWTVVRDSDDHCYYDYYDDDDDDDDEKKEEDVDVEVEVEEEQQEEAEDDKEEEVQNENNEMLASKNREWDSDDDNFLNIEDYDTSYSKITFLGFHPYKEVVFLALPSFVGVAYH